MLVDPVHGLEDVPRRVAHKQLAEVARQLDERRATAVGQAPAEEFGVGHGVKVGSLGWQHLGDDVKEITVAIEELEGEDLKGVVVEGVVLVAGHKAVKLGHDQTSLKQARG